MMIAWIVWILCVWTAVGGSTHGHESPRAGVQREANVDSPVAKHALEKLRQVARLKDSWDPFVQTVPPESPTFVIGGTTIPFVDLVPMDDLFSPNTVGMVDGMEEPPETTVYRSVNHPSIYAMLDDDHSLLRAFRLLPDGNLLDLVPIDNTSFAEIDTFRDMEPFAEEADAGAVDPPYASRGVFAGHNNFLRRRMSGQRVGPGCETVAKASVFLAADSDFACDAELECDMCSFSSRAGAAKSALQLACSTKI